jgi:capsular polysaccharide biosynthesis protein
VTKVLDDVFVNPEGLIFRRGHIYPESFPLPRYAEDFRGLSAQARFLLKNHWLRRGWCRVPSALWVIDHVFVSANYFHWMVEALTRILTAERCRPDQHVLLLPDRFRRLPFVGFTLQAFPLIERVQWIGERTKARVSALVYIPRLPPQPPERLPAAEDLAEVARRVAGLAGEHSTAPYVYFSRAGIRRRRIRNEEDVLRILRAYDFQIIQSDHLKPWEQVQCCLGAEIAVGVHGAALTNLMFMPRGARLLELRHPLYHWDVYDKLATIFGIRYSCQMCEPADAGLPPGIDPYDVIVDLDQLRETLNEWTR